MIIALKSKQYFADEIFEVTFILFESGYKQANSLRKCTPSGTQQ
jgi:hypothetical protein